MPSTTTGGKAGGNAPLAITCSGPITRSKLSKYSELPVHTFTAPFDSSFWRVARNQRGIDRADRNARDPVGLVRRAGQFFENASLISAQCATALKHEGDVFVVPGNAGRL